MEVLANRRERTVGQVRDLRLRDVTAAPLHFELRLRDPDSRAADWCENPPDDQNRFVRALIASSEVTR
jgi:hypothetical protein